MTRKYSDNPVYLNNATTGWPKAPGVSEAVHAAIDEPPYHPGRGAGRGADYQEECRLRLAGLLNTDDPSRIVLTVNGTQALNLAIGGLALAPGSHVVTTVAEHNSVLRPLRHLEVERGVRLTIVGLNESGELDSKAFETALDDKPVLAAVNHASNVSGRVNDAAPLLALAKQAGAVTLLDAAQSLGHVPVHAESLHADLIAFTGHKGLHGPAGTGGLYVAPHIELRQIYVGGTGIRSDLPLHPGEMPARLEAGTPNMAALAGLAAALRWHAEHAEPAREAEIRLARRLREGLRRHPGVRIFDDDDRAERLGVISISLAGWEVEEVGYVLEESFGVACRTGLHCAPLIHEPLGSAPAGTIRLSISSFNSDSDIEAALQAVAALSECKSRRETR